MPLAVKLFDFYNLGTAFQSIVKQGCYKIEGFKTNLRVSCQGRLHVLASLQLRFLLHLFLFNKYM